MIGSRRDYVKRIVVGYSVYEYIERKAFFKIPGLSEESFYFNYIADSLNKSAISEFLGVDLDAEDPINHLNGENVKQWTKWLFEKYGENQTRLKGRSADLTKLNAILANDIAKNAFIDNSASLNEAFALTADLHDIFRVAVKRAVSELERADSLMHRLSTFYLTLNDDLRSINKLARKIKTAKDELQDDESNGDDS